MSKILVVDDEKSIIDSLTMILSYENYDVEGALDGFSALDKVKSDNYDLILLDIKMPRMDGLEVLEKIMDYDKDLVVIIISGHGTIETAVEATKKGAYNFLQKPFPELHELKLIIKNAIEYKHSKDRLNRLRDAQYETYKLIGSSEAVSAARELVKKFADVNSNVLITGESGTGKELVAWQIHLQSNRADKPFVKINCANISSNIIDEELFGLYRDNKLVSRGKFEEAEGGTIFFDEISNLSFEVQSKLLKVIEENKFTRPGANKDITLDVRFIFSTNKDILLETDEGRFRDDLYHRINVLQINLPPLRERPEDIEELTKYFTEQICAMNNVPCKEFAPGAIALFKTFRWPGNVRELRNLIERLIFTTDKEIIDAEDIEIPGTKHTRILTDLINKNMSLNDFQNESEKLFLMKMLNDYKYNISQTAEALQIQRSHLYKLMNKYDIPLPSKIK